MNEPVQRISHERIARQAQAVVCRVEAAVGHASRGSADRAKLQLRVAAAELTALLELIERLGDEAGKPRL